MVCYGCSFKHNNIIIGLDFVTFVYRRLKAIIKYSLSPPPAIPSIRTSYGQSFSSPEYFFSRIKRLKRIIFYQANTKITILSLVYYTLSTC